MGSTGPERDLLSDALALPATDRARLAQALLLSLDEGTDADAEAAWAEEVRRRLEDVDAGRVTLQGWDEVRAQLAVRRK